jgi:hypothetical protein
MRKGRPLFKALLASAAAMFGGMAQPQLGVANHVTQAPVAKNALPAKMTESAAVQRAMLPTSLGRYFRHSEPIWTGRMRQGRNAGRNAFWNGGRR